MTYMICIRKSKGPSTEPCGTPHVDVLCVRYVDVLCVSVDVLDLKPLTYTVSIT